MRNCVLNEILNSSMFLIIDILLSLLLIGFNSVEMIRIYVLKKDKNVPLVALTSTISIGFGLYLIVKNGLVIDYGTQAEISESWAGPMWFLGVVCLFLGLGFILGSILKYIFVKLKHTFTKKTTETT